LPREVWQAGFARRYPVSASEARSAALPREVWQAGFARRYPVSASEARSAASPREVWQAGFARRYPVRYRSPIETKTFAVPANHGAWLDDYQGVFPARPEPEECNPERAIERAERGSRLFVSVCRELLAQRQLDDCLFVAASEEGESAVKKSHREIE